VAGLDYVQNDCTGVAPYAAGNEAKVRKTAAGQFFQSTSTGKMCSCVTEVEDTHIGSISLPM
jgi:hypothetical protein